jgi:hypothetical protein
VAEHWDIGEAWHGHKPEMGTAHIGHNDAIVFSVVRR